MGSPGKKRGFFLGSHRTHAHTTRKPAHVFYDKTMCKRAFSTDAVRFTTMEELIEELNRAARDWRLYSLRARLLTGIFRNRWFPIYGSDFQLDHKYSIRWGHLNRVPLEGNRGRPEIELS